MTAGVKETPIHLTCPWKARQAHHHLVDCSTRLPIANEGLAVGKQPRQCLRTGSLGEDHRHGCRVAAGDLVLSCSQHPIPEARELCRTHPRDRGYIQPGPVLRRTIPDDVSTFRAVDLFHVIVEVLRLIRVLHPLRVSPDHIRECASGDVRAPRSRRSAQAWSR